ncbi:macro domain-containing protein [Nanoarchaeota archaeon]
MIRYVQGNLFQSDADALAHGCNTVRKMNAGIAKDFRRYFPHMFSDYKKRCSQRLFLPGDGYIYRNNECPHVINLATQADGPAKEEYLGSSLDWLAENFDDLGLQSVAMPRIGTGLGGLEWRTVNDMLKERFYDSPLKLEVWNL